MLTYLVQWQNQQKSALFENVVCDQDLWTHEPENVINVTWPQ